MMRILALVILLSAYHLGLAWGQISTPPQLGNTTATIPLGEVRCPADRVVVGLRLFGAPPPTRYCVGCFMGVELICEAIVTTSPAN